MSWLQFPFYLCQSRILCSLLITVSIPGRLYHFEIPSFPLSKTTCNGTISEERYILRHFQNLLSSFLQYNKISLYLLTSIMSYIFHTFRTADSLKLNVPVWLERKLLMLWAVGPGFCMAHPSSILIQLKQPMQNVIAAANTPTPPQIKTKLLDLIFLWLRAKFASQNRVPLMPPLKSHFQVCSQTLPLFPPP